MIISHQTIAAQKPSTRTLEKVKFSFYDWLLLYVYSVKLRKQNERVSEQNSIYDFCNWHTKKMWILNVKFIWYTFLVLCRNTTPPAERSIVKKNLNLCVRIVGGHGRWNNIDNCQIAACISGLPRPSVCGCPAADRPQWGSTVASLTSPRQAPNRPRLPVRGG